MLILQCNSSWSTSEFYSFRSTLSEAIITIILTVMKLSPCAHTLWLLLWMIIELKHETRSRLFFPYDLKKGLNKLINGSNTHDSTSLSLSFCNRIILYFLKYFLCYQQSYCFFPYFSSDECAHCNIDSSSSLQWLCSYVIRC